VRLAGKRVAVYARFSSDRQRDASIDDQVHRCRDFVEGHGGKVSPDLVLADHAVSGASLQRPAFERLMELATAKPRRIDAIVVEDVSRLSRDFADAADLFKRLRYHEVALLGVADGIDSTAANGKVTYTVKSMVAEMYLDDLRDKTLRGLQGRARAGYSTGGLAFGFRSVAELDARGEVVGHRIEVNPERAEVIRRIFRDYLDGHSLAGIAARLNREGVANPRAGTRHATRGWGMGTIRAMLHNERYTGAWSFGERRWVKAPGTNKRRPRPATDREIIRQDRPELRVIDEPTWCAVQERLAGVRAKYTRADDGSPKGRALGGRGAAHPLSGLLVCGDCGHPLIIYGGSSSSGGPRYRCPDNRKGMCGNGLSVGEAIVLRRFLPALRDHLASPAGLAHIRKRVAERLGSLARETRKELAERRERLARTVKRVQGLVVMQAEGDRSEYVSLARRDLEAQARSERAAIADLEARASEPVHLPTVQAVVERVLDLEAAFSQDPVRARESLRRLLGDGRIRMEPQSGAYVARAAVLPLVIMLAASDGRSLVSSRSSGGPQLDFPDHWVPFARMVG
jgi:DNA invertase Pin-like site-specific DNA recombinase